VTAIGSRVALPYVGPFERPSALALLAAHAVPGLEEVDAERGTVRRLLAVEGHLRPVTVALGPTEVALTVDEGPVTDELVRRVRRWFDLDLDPASLQGQLGADPYLGPSLRARPGLRVLGHPAGFEAAVTTVLGQHVSLAAGRTFAGRLVAAFGAAGPGGLADFPSPAILAGAAPAVIQAATGITGARARTVQALAEACADDLAIDSDGDHAEIRRRLLALPGIGPWTVEYLAVRALGDRDAFPAGDLVLRRALGGTTARRVEILSQAWRPYRAYALVHLWSTVWPPGRRT
jgi:3-methyladenine DNA glycosylase/8-oxoguanine DNA glycosylase